MSAHDDRTEQPQTLSGSALFEPGGSPAREPATGGDTNAGRAEPGTGTATEPGTEPGTTTRSRSGPGYWHGGLDLALFVLRLVLGGTLVAHGLQKFGLFDGPGLDGFARGLESFGYTGQTTLLAWVTALAEVGGGVLLVLGLFTPLGAAAALGVLVNAIAVKVGAGFFAGQGGFEYELVLAATAFALLFTGSGRLALDRNTPWRHRPLVFGLVALTLAAGSSAAVLVLLR
ncbi:DoxX family protein [Saccharomonospora iraqiensis]|uniref:DoxX family protein n=1 Tax=Saccharomonospora iraqiensis TaxID=52698 RepID=UPI00022E15F2|nr:DoxX family protein [Saccharomonospora iraqiensis]